MTAKTKDAAAPEKQDKPAPIIDERVLALTPPDGGLRVDIPTDVLAAAGVLGLEHPWAKGYSPEVRAVPYGRVDPSPLNHRTIFLRIEQLARSLQEEGLRTPLLGRPSPKDPTRIELVVGERRQRAMGLLNKLAAEASLPSPWAGVPMRIRELTDAEVIIEQAIENLDREDPHPLEEAMIYEKLCAPLHEGGQGFSIEQAAAKTRRDPSHIAQSMKLLALRPRSREAFLREEIVLGHALVLARIPKPDKGPDLQDELLSDILIGRDGRSRPEDAAVMTVAAARKHAQQHYMLPIAKAPFDVTDTTLHPTRGACGGCEYNTDHQGLLFADVARGSGLCTKPDCWETKVDAAWDREKAAAKKSGQKVLTDAEAKAVFPYQGGYIAHDTGYVGLDEHVHGLGGQNTTYRAAFKKAKIETPPITLARTPYKVRVELISKADAEKVIRALRKDAPSTSNSSNDKYKKEQAAAKEKTRIGNIIFGALMAAIVVAFEKMRDPGDTTIRMLARALVRSVWAETLDAVVKRRALEPKAEPAPAAKGKKAAKKKAAAVNGVQKRNQDNEALVMAHVDGLKGKGPLLAFVLEVTLTRSAAGRPLDETPELAEVCTALKVDAKQIKATVEAAEKKNKPKAKSKAKAAKTPTKAAKKGEPKRPAPARKAAKRAEEDDDDQEDDSAADKPELRRGGPETCPKPCSECKAGEHHFSEAMIESAKNEPKHPAAKAGVDFWYACKHCPAWLEWDPDAEDAGGDEGQCRVCGCTDEAPCPIEGEGTCAWVDTEMTLCTACAELMDKAEEYCEPATGKPLGREALIECIRRDAFALWAGELYENLSEADRATAAKAYTDARLGAVIGEAVQLERLVEVAGGFVLGPSALPRIKDLLGPSVELTPREPGAESVTVTPPEGAAPGPMCVTCITALAAKSDDLCVADRGLVDQVLKVIWERTFVNEPAQTEEQLAEGGRIDAGPRRIRTAIAYLRDRKLLGPDMRGRVVLTPLPPSPPRTKAERDLDVLVVQQLVRGDNSALQIVLVLDRDGLASLDQVTGSLRYLAGAHGLHPEADVKLAAAALENSLAGLKIVEDSREDLIDRTLRAELTTGEKTFDVLGHAAARTVGLMTATSKLFAIEVRASLRRIVAEERATDPGVYRLVQPAAPTEHKVLMGSTVCAVCANEILPDGATDRRCEACGKLCARVVACIKANPDRWSHRAFTPEVFADHEADGMTPDQGALIRPHLLKRVVEHLVARGELLLVKGKLTTPTTIALPDPVPATWKELIGPSKVERLVHQRLHASGHHRVLVIGARVSRTAGILHHVTSPRRATIYIVEHDDEAREQGPTPLGVDLLARYPGEPPLFDRVLVLPSPIGGVSTFDEVVAIENAYARVQADTGRLVAVVTPPTAADPKIKALIARHNGTTEELEDDERHLGTGLVLVSFYKVTPVPAGKLSGLRGGKAVPPAAAPKAGKAKGKAAGKAQPKGKSGPIPPEVA